MVNSWKGRRKSTSVAQEQSYVRSTRDPAFRTASSKPMDCVVFRNGGYVEVVDCKFSDNGSMVVSKDDIAKGLKLVSELQRRGHNAILVLDIWFPGKRIRRRWPVPSDMEGWSIRFWTVGQRLMSKKVRRG